MSSCELAQDAGQCSPSQIRSVFDVPQVSTDFSPTIRRRWRNCPLQTDSLLLEQQREPPPAMRFPRTDDQPAQNGPACLSKAKPSITQVDASFSLFFDLSAGL